MTLRAEVYLDSREMVVGAALAAVPDVTVDLEPQATAEFLLFTVRTPDDPQLLAAFERAMSEDTTVESFRSISPSGTEVERAYAAEVGVERPLMSEVSANLGINVLTTYSRYGESGWTFELAVPDRETLAELRSFWGQRGVPFEVRRLFTDTEDGREFGLSTVQRETLQVAAEEGYFDVPRGISQGELAELLDASPTAVSQRLRRATAELVTNTIGTASSDRSDDRE